MFTNIKNIIPQKPDHSGLIDLEKYKLPGSESSPLRTATIHPPLPKPGFDICDYEMIFNDKETKRLIREGRTIGCFYIESPGMRSLLQRLNCDTFEMLTAASSVIRPGVAESGMMQEFIARHKNPNRRKYLIPQMEKYLGETYGVMIYQEDVIKVAHHIVGLSLEEADYLRRAMSGKMRSQEAMKQLLERFFDSCKSKKLSDRVAKKLWDEVSSFAGYAFCKAHSASFAILSFQVAYLKAHHPAEFMSNVLNNGGGFYSSGVYINESKRMGLKVLLPSINESDYRYIGNSFQIRIGFIAIGNIEKKTSIKIVEERNKNGRYKSLADFIARTKTTYEKTKILIKCGAMDCLHKTRPTLMRLADIYYHCKNMLDYNSQNLFNQDTSLLERSVETPLQYSDSEIGAYEQEHLGFMVTRHPIEFIKEIFESPGVVKAEDLIRYRNRRIKMVGWFMTSKRIKTRKGDIMKFLSLEDFSGTFEAVLFPKTYNKYAELTMSLGPYLVEGKADLENGNNIIVEKLEVLSYKHALEFAQKDSSQNKYYGDVEKVTEEEFTIAKSLDTEKLRKAYV
jgi:DNA polymerase III alpha subunit